MKFIHHDQDGGELALVLLEKNYGNHYFIQAFCMLGKKEEDWAKIDTTIWCKLIQDAFVESKKIPELETLAFRMIEWGDCAPIARLLEELGFLKEQDRIEYRRELAELPGDEGSPLVWSAIPSLEIADLEKVVDLLKQAAVGDPSFDPDADSLAELQADLKDFALTTGAHCIHIGHIDGKQAAVVFVQINPKTKWSRITYMGLLPEFRGTGLGKWVHRHGFEMMRTQGGSLYHGGTVSTNQSMIRLFETHGCKVFRRMQEWKCVR